MWLKPGRDGKNMSSENKGRPPLVGSSEKFAKNDSFTFQLAGKKVTVDRASVAIDLHPEYESDEVVVFDKAVWAELVRIVEKCWEVLGPGT